MRYDEAVQFIGYGKWANPGHAIPGAPDNKKQYTYCNFKCGCGKWANHDASEPCVHICRQCLRRKH